MRYITIEKARPGMELAKPVFDSRNHILLAKGNCLTQEYIRKLARRGYPGIYITDALTEDIIIEETITSELRNCGVEALRRHDLDATLEVAKSIISEILQSKSVSLDMIDLRTFDDYTYRHSVNVAVMSGIIGMHLNLSENELVNLCIAAIFHDLGKLMIDPTILNKPAKLIKEEYEQIKAHPILAVELLKDRWNVAASSRVGILHHHENEDGSGYPDGLKSDEIHIFSKIIHVVDVYDALTSKRPYKNPYSCSEAVEYLFGGNSILFDEKVIHAFRMAVPVYPKGVSVYLSDGREAIVVANTANPLRPVIRLLDGSEVNLYEAPSYRNITINTSTEVETDFSDEISIYLPEEKQRKIIMLVDPKVLNLQTLRSTLESNYTIVMVKSGIQAIAYLNYNRHPDLILIDIDLPQMDGIKTVQYIKEELKVHIPIIFVTEKSDYDTVLKCRRIKAADYILCPFQPMYIQERIRLVLGEA